MRIDWCMAAAARNFPPSENRERGYPGPTTAELGVSVEEPSPSRPSSVPPTPSGAGPTPPSVGPAVAAQPDAVGLHAYQGPSSEEQYGLPAPPGRSGPSRVPWGATERPTGQRSLSPAPAAPLPPEAAGPLAEQSDPQSDPGRAGTTESVQDQLHLLSVAMRRRSPSGQLPGHPDPPARAAGLLRSRDRTQLASSQSSECHQTCHRPRRRGRASSGA